MTDLAQALGRIPSGMFIVTAGRLGAGGAEEATGMLGTFVQQVGFEPPMISVGVKQGRPILDLMRSGGFCVSVLHRPSAALMKHFARGFEPGVPAFEDVNVGQTEDGVPYLEDALAWVHCRLHSEHEPSDHLVVFGEVLGGEKRDDGEPMIHTRRNGLNY